MNAQKNKCVRFVRVDARESSTMRACGRAREARAGADAGARARARESETGDGMCIRRVMTRRVSVSTSAPHARGRASSPLDRTAMRGVMGLVSHSIWRNTYLWNISMERLDMGQRK